MKSGLNEKWIVCRVCLKQPNETMQTIFDKSAEKDLTRMILECGGVPIKQFDHYPDKICSKCLKYLHVAYKFRLTCQRSHKHLSKFIAPVVVEKVDEGLFEEDVETGPLTVTVPEEMDATLIVEEEAEDADFKLEPHDTMGVKQELPEQFEENDDDFVEIYEPLAEEEEKVFELDVDDSEICSLSSLAEEEEYLEMEDMEVLTSDEEFIPSAYVSSKKRGKSKTSSRFASISQAGTSREFKRKVSKAEADDLTGDKRTKGTKREPKAKKIKETSFICHVCGNKYPSQGRLTEHIKLHKGIKPHECEICGHAFAQTQQLARHMNTHTGNRPYKCSYCPAAFADLSTRNKHHRIHTNERPYVCDVCGKTFTYTNTLKFHKMIHTGEKPYVCDICGKGFQQSYKLRNHKLTHERKAFKDEKNEVDAAINYQEVKVDTAQLLEILTLKPEQSI